MGKKQGEAQRVKGNLKPSSSAKAAEMLQQFASNSGSYGFGADIAPIGIGTLMEDTFDSSIDSDFRMVLRKLYKKDAQTKTKALEELKGLVETKSQEDCIATLPYWSKSYTKLTVDNDRKIRELCQQTHEKLCAKVSKSIAPHLKTIMPYWLLAQADSFIPAGRIAENSFKTMFNEAKQPEVVLFAKDEILNVLHEYLIVETAKTLSDMKSTSEDEAQLKYETVICMSLRGLSLFLKYYYSNPPQKLFKPQVATNETGDSSTTPKPSCAKLEKIFNEPKFWKFSRDTSLKIRSDFFHLISSAIDEVLLNPNLANADEAFLTFHKNLKLKIVPLVFYACDEDSQSCCFYVWESILKCLKNSDRLDPDIWSLLNVKKAFIPKLTSLLKNHANGNANNQNIEIVYAGLAPLIRKLDKIFSDEERIEFYKDFFAKLNDAVFKESSVKTRFNFASNRIRMVYALFDCLSFVFENKLNFDFCASNLLGYVLKLCEKYLDQDGSGDGLGFELKFQKFIEETIEPGQIKDQFWTELSLILKNKLNTDDNLLLLGNFSGLFKSCQSSCLAQLIEILFNKFYDLFEASLNQNERSATHKYLVCLNKLCMDFKHVNFLDLFTSKASLTGQLESFNKTLIEGLLAKIQTNQAETETDYLLSAIIELFLIINAKKVDASLIKQLDYYLFELINESNQYQVENLIQNYLLNKIEPKLSHSLTEWLIHSDKAKQLLINKTFSQAKLFTEPKINKLAVQLVKNLVECEQPLNLSKQNESVQTFVLKFIEYIASFAKASNISKLINLNELENYLAFSSSLLFECASSVKAYVAKLLTVDQLWAILLNNLLLKSSLKLKNKHKIGKINKLETELNAFINKLTFKLIDEYLDFEEVEDLSSSFKELTGFITENLNNPNKSQFILNDLLLNLIHQFKSNKELKKSWMMEFYANVLFKLDGLATFRSIFTSISNVNFLANVYLDNLCNYTYTQLYPKLTSIDVDSLAQTDENKLVWLKQTSYALTLLNECAQTVGLSEFLMFKSNSLVSKGQWVYLLLNAMVLNKYNPDKQANQLNKSIQAELNKFVYDSQSLAQIFDFLNDERSQELFVDLAKCLFGNNDNKLELSNVSLFLANLVDSCLQRPNTAKLLNSVDFFARNLVAHAACIPNLGITEEEIRFYVYDLPFAKHSVVDNLSQLSENVEYYYSLFSQVIEQQLSKLSENVIELKALNLKFELSAFVNSLALLNFNLDILTKYVKTYLSLLNEKNNEAFKILNLSPSTDEFIRAKLSGYLAQVIGLFVDLKGSLTNKMDPVLGSGVGGYSFYFGFDLREVGNEKLRWEQFGLLDKLNKFLSLFFMDYKLKSSQSQQFSQYLSEKDWDFILCYSASAIQKINKSSEDNKLCIQIFEISFFNLINLVIRCMQSKCRDNLTGNYPKSVYSDWNGFFAKEIFDPLLCIYVKLAEKNTNLAKTNVITQCAIKKLSSAVSLMPIERLILNVLEPKFNVLDLDMGAVSMSPNPKKQVIHLTDPLKSVINHLTPHLKHEIKSVQMGSFRILKTLMKNMSKYYRVESGEEDSGSVIESLPYIMKETVNEVNGLFVDIKSTVEFGQSVLVSNIDQPDTEDEEEEHIENDQKTEPEQIFIDLNKSVSTKKPPQLSQQEANNKLISYLISNTLMLEMLSTDLLEFKVKLVNDLRELSLNDHLMHMLFRLMPSFKHASLKLFTSKADMSYLDDEFELETLTIQEEALNEYNLDPSCVYESFTNKNVELFACKLYKYMLKCVPALIRDWWNIQPKRIADQVDKYTTKYVSPVLIEEEIKHINRSANLVNEQPGANEPLLAEVKTETPQGPAKKTIVIEDDEQSTIKIRGMLSTREVVSTYKMKELNMELIIQLPVNHPLGGIEVSSVRRLGVSENEWRNWLLQLTTYLTHQNGSIIQSLQIWKKNVDKKFSGVEECTICYSVIHGTNYQLPKMKCRTCRKLFHSICLYKWFESSSKSTCPLCRNLF